MLLQRDPAEDPPGGTDASPRRGFDTRNVPIYTAGMASFPGEALGREALAYADALHNLARYLTDAHERVEPWWFFIPCVLIATLPWAGSLFRFLREKHRNQ